MRILLKLPPCLRQSVFLQRVSQSTSNGRHSLNSFQSRTFTCTRNLLARPQAPPKPFRKPTKVQEQPPQPAPRKVLPRCLGPSRIGNIAPELDRVLLYKAPSHGTFFVVSYLTGAIFLFGAYNIAYTFTKDHPDMPKSPWYIKTLSSIPAWFMVILGTVCMLAPTKVIKSLAIVTQNGKRILRFEIKRPLPFVKPDIMETPVSKVALNKNVPGFAADLNFTDVRLSEAKMFTENYFSNAEDAPEKGGVTGALSSFNRSLLNTWPAAKREIRRMLMRDQMAYVRVEGNGNFKLDLQGCSLLERGVPIERIIDTDESEHPSIASWIMRFFK